MLGLWGEVKSRGSGNNLGELCDGLTRGEGLGNWVNGMKGWQLTDCGFCCCLEFEPARAVSSRVSISWLTWFSAALSLCEFNASTRSKREMFSHLSLLQTNTFSQERCRLYSFPYLEISCQWQKSFLSPHSKSRKKGFREIDHTPYQSFTLPIINSPLTATHLLIFL